MALSPKEVARQIAQTIDGFVDALEAPVRNLASQLGLPVIERPKLADLVEMLPELPGPEQVMRAPIAPAGRGEVVRVKPTPQPAPAPQPAEQVRVRIV